VPGIRHGSTGALAVMLILSLPPTARAEEKAPRWSDSFVAQVEALALIQTLNADLLSHDSATLTLETWCVAHRLAVPATIAAERVHAADKPATAELRALLRVGDAEPVRYRHVRLHCGGRVLSEADNWYVPSRLTAEMNQSLDTTDTPFGRAVQTLHFQRRTLSAKLLWQPLPDGWEMGAHNRDLRGSLPIPPAILEHRAVLTLPDGTPFSAVVETYTSDILAFPEPPEH
jgi:chorismate-pyruvate lyase